MVNCSAYHIFVCIRLSGNNSVVFGDLLAQHALRNFINKGQILSALKQILMHAFDAYYYCIAHFML